MSGFKTIPSHNAMFVLIFLNIVTSSNYDIEMM